MITDYFADNTAVQLQFQEVTDAFNIAGEFRELPLDPAGLGKRDTCPEMFDLTSLFRSYIRWDPYSPIQAWRMCTDIPAGPGKL